MLSPELRYLCIKIARKLYDDAFASLTTEQQEKVIDQAQQAFAIGLAALSSTDAQGIELPEDRLLHAVTEIQGRYPNAALCAQDLMANGLNMEDLRCALAHELKLELLMEKVGQRAADVTELDVRLYYHLQKRRFEVPERRAVRHILITVNPEFAENTPQKAQQRLLQIRQQLRDGIQDFATLAMQHSECPSAMQGGLLGVVPQGTLFPTLDAALFRMSKGDISDVLESELGLHILCCEEIHLAGRIPLHEAWDAIHKRLTKRRQENCQRIWLAKLVE